MMDFVKQHARAIPRVFLEVFHIHKKLKARFRIVPAPESDGHGLYRVRRDRADSGEDARIVRIAPKKASFGKKLFEPTLLEEARPGRNLCPFAE